jgi:hypothetical protein
MCHWISVKAVSFGVAVGLGRKLSKASAGAGDGDALGRRSPPWRRLHQALPFSTSRHEDNYDLSVMGALLLWHERFVGSGHSRRRAFSTVEAIPPTSSCSLPSIASVV